MLINGVVWEQTEKKADGLVDYKGSTRRYDIWVQSLIIYWLLIRQGRLKPLVLHALKFGHHHRNVTLPMVNCDGSAYKSKVETRWRE